MKLQPVIPETCPKTEWSGGTTTQFAIDPPEGNYGKRDFNWRISSATVDLEESDFTSLPDYERWISVLEGEMKLSHSGKTAAVLKPGQVYCFDGGVPTHSEGKCRDFNLMLKKGRVQGEMKCLTISEGQVCTLPSDGDLFLYVTKGTVSLNQNSLGHGEGGLIRNVNGSQLRANENSAVMICEIRKC